MVYTYHEFIIQQTLPGHIHRLGGLYLGHLGEVRRGLSGDQPVTQRKGYSFRAAGNLAFTLALFGLGVFFGLLPCHKLANEVWAGSVAKDVDDVDWDT